MVICTIRNLCILSFGFFLGVIFTIGCDGGSGSAIAESVTRAIDVVFDNSTNGMDSTEVQSAIEELQTRIDELEIKTAAMTATDDDVYFTGVNLHVRNGDDRTDSINGKGNLIVGYDENAGDTKTGSHNIVLGLNHTYTSYCGVICGYNNSATSSYCNVFGANNSASAQGATISGGVYSRAENYFSTISGGNAKTTTHSYDHIP